MVRRGESAGGTARMCLLQLCRRGMRCAATVALRPGTVAASLRLRTAQLTAAISAAAWLLFDSFLFSRVSSRLSRTSRTSSASRCSTVVVAVSQHGENSRRSGAGSGGRNCAAVLHASGASIAARRTVAAVQRAPAALVCMSGLQRRDQPLIRSCSATQFFFLSFLAVPSLPLLQRRRPTTMPASV